MGNDLQGVAVVGARHELQPALDALAQKMASSLTQMTCRQPILDCHAACSIAYLLCWGNRVISSTDVSLRSGSQHHYPDTSMPSGGVHPIAYEIGASRQKTPLSCPCRSQCSICCDIHALFTPPMRTSVHDHWPEYVVCTLEDAEVTDPSQPELFWA